MPHDLQITSYYCPSIYKKEVNLLAMNECTTKRKGAIRLSVMNLYDLCLKHRLVLGALGPM